ncbi:MAG: hypothetical protein HZB38_03970 [Planctomycetes bacterium]|nr:hypothetical protein [Planctomycetota bacterium]
MYRRWYEIAVILCALSVTALAQPTLWYVTQTGSGSGASWGDPCSLQAALGGSQSGDQVWVKYGTYFPTVRYPNDADGRHATFKVKLGVKVYGGFLGITTGDPDGEQYLTERNPEVNLTVLDGNINVNGNPNADAYHVVTFDGANNITKLSGFVIRNGRADHPTDVRDRRGGGIFIPWTDGNGGTPLLNRLVIQDNYAAAGGGGLYAAGKDVTNVANCRFENNVVGSGTGGGAMVHEGNAYFQNCVFVGNEVTTGSGGGLASIFFDGEISYWAAATNCTFFANTSSQSGSALFSDIDWFGLVAYNSVIWQPGSDPIKGTTGDSVWILDSDISYDPDHDWYGVNNISDDPLFRDETNRIVRVRHCSPVLDLGYNLHIAADETDVNDSGTVEPVIPWDFDKGPRLLVTQPGDNDHIVDMGAYEECLAGDIDGNGRVELSDLTQLLACFGLMACNSAPPCCIADIAGPSSACFDGAVDISDLALLLGQFGLVCPSERLTIGGGEESMMGGSDPLTEWLRSAAPEDVLDWWYAGMPPIGGGEY